MDNQESLDLKDNIVQIKTLRNFFQVDLESDKVAYLDFYLLWEKSLQDFKKIIPNAILECQKGEISSDSLKQIYSLLTTESHKAKSSSLRFGANQLGFLFKKLELTTNGEPNTEKNLTIIELLNQLKECIEVSLEEVNTIYQRFFCMIWVVDDNEFDRLLITKKIKSQGFEVCTFVSGSECLEKLKTTKPNLLLLDVQMEIMDGNLILKEIRNKFTSLEVPIIMVTGNAESGSILTSLRAGANDYITKPIDFDILLMRILNQLQIIELSNKMSKMKEIETITSMIATYNHEINNPLAIVIGLLNLIKKQIDPVKYEKIEKSLWRVSDTVKKIENLTLDASKIEHEIYVGNQKMIKLLG